MARDDDSSNMLKTRRNRTRERVHTYYQWQMEGYDVDELTKALDTPKFNGLFLDYEAKVGRMKQIEGVIQLLDDAGYFTPENRAEIDSIRSKLRDPCRIMEVEEAFYGLNIGERGQAYLSEVEERLRGREIEPFPRMPKVAMNEEPAMAITSAAEPPIPALEPGRSYLVHEDRPNRCFYIFGDLVARGFDGVCITREFPDKLKTRYDLGSSSIFWLSNTDMENSFRPKELGKLYTRLEEFISKEERSTVLLSGLEYLITQNNFISVLKMIQLLTEQVAVHDSILIVPISPSALAERELKMIEQELTVLI